MVDAVIDFENRSRLALGETNIYKYARHPSTEVLCMAYSIDGGPVELWRPGDLFPFEKQWPDVRLLAFNAEFELMIWSEICTPRHGWPQIYADMMDCLQARSAYAGWPRGLDSVCTAIGLGKEGKDMEGNAVMNRLCKPVRASGNPVAQVGCEYLGGLFDKSEDKHQRNYEYCIRDVNAEHHVHRVAPDLPPAEKELWLVHQRINDRGVPVDIDLCRNASSLAVRERKHYSERLAKITGRDDITPNCSVWLKDWLRGRGYPFHSLGKQCVETALGLTPGMPALDLQPECMEVLEIRKLCRDAAVTKYDAILNHAEADNRCRGAHVFYKAGPGRFAGAGVNFMNMRRLAESEIESNIEWADRVSEADETDLDEIYEDLRLTGKGVIPTLGSMVRFAVCAPPGKKLVVCDYSSIEYRVLHWLADDTRTLKIIADFDAGKGDDPYKIAAALIYAKVVADVDKAERQIGKVQVLGCGYMSGANTFQAFCAGYGIDMTHERAQEIVRLYRRNNPLVVNLWYSIGKCAVKTVRTGRSTKVGRIEFFTRGSTLNVRLPSGRLMKYYDPKIVDGRYGDEIEAIDQRSGGRRAVGLPILVENCDQAASRDLLADALIKCDLAKLPVVLHCYDEIVMEVDENDNETPGILRKIMRDPPSWARGLPIDAKLGEGRRYTK